ncbi:MAG: hypothetical protein ABIF88_03635 [archaeon]
MEENVESLTVRELLRDTHLKLLIKNSGGAVDFRDKVLTEIADDSDHHRTRKGYMEYPGTGIFDYGGKTWAIAHGENGGGYPADRYNSDLLALELATKERTAVEIREELAEAIRQSTYFENSLLFGFSDGNLAMSRTGRFSGRLKDRIFPHIDGFIAQRAEYNHEIILASTLQHPVTQTIRYKPEFVDFLVDAIEEVLR